MLSHLLDTSVYSQRLRPSPCAGVVARWSRLGDAHLAISAVCEAELLYGLQRRNTPRLWSEYHDFLENRLVLLPVDASVARAYGELRAKLDEAGTPRSQLDLLIAATAISHGLTLATLNVRHFKGLPGLLVEDWSTVP